MIEIDIDEENPVRNVSFSKRYSNLKKIGFGGMSVVFAGHDGVLDREVAIKRLKISTQGERAWFRFQQEARACAALRHPNIVSIFDFGADDDHVPYIVLDYLRGKTLAQLIEDRGQLTFIEMFEIIVPLLDGLEHAHKSGIVHRDLKPANVFLQTIESSNQTVVKIMDFGIAKVITDGESGFETKTGEVFGSPFYISPEQLGSEKVDGRSDLYALGCMMFEMITGKPPFVGKSVLSTFMMHKNDSPPAIDQRLKNRPICKRVAEIVEKLLDKSPEYRYQNVAQLRDDLTSARDEWLKNRSAIDDEKRFAQGKRVVTNYSNKLRHTFQQTGPFLKTRKGFVCALAVLGLVAATCYVILAPLESDRPAVVPPSKLTTLTHQVSQRPLTINELKEQLRRYPDALKISGATNLDELADSIPTVFSNVDEVELEDLPISAAALSKLKGMKRLTRIRLEEVTGLSPEVFSAVASIKSVKKLEIKTAGVTVPDGALACLKNMQLESLFISLSLSEQHVKDIAEISTLRALTLAAPMEEVWVSQLGALSELERLELECVGTTGCGLGCLSKMNLVSLKLKANPLELSCLKRLEPLPDCTELDVEGSLEVGDEEFCELCRIFPNVQFLCLKDTRITDAAAEKFANLKALTNLDVAKTPISSKSIPIFAGLRRLRTIELDNCRVDSQGVITLMRHHPRLEIEANQDPDPTVTAEMRSVARETRCRLKLKDVFSPKDLDALQSRLDQPR